MSVGGDGRWSLGAVVGIAWLASLGSATLGCGDDDGSAGETCAAGETGSCTLPGGGDGVRVCGPSFRWEACAAATDGGVGEDGIQPPVEPAAPEWPCPAGWRVTSIESGTETCDPWPEAGHADCATTEAHFPGEASCAPVGPPCPVDGLPADVPVDRTVIWVRAGSAGGDGSRARPLDTIGGALSIVDPGGVVAIGVGDYGEALAPVAPVTLLGACVGETVLRGSRRQGPLTLADGVEVASLRLESGANVAVTLAEAGTATLRAVVVLGTDQAIAVDRGSLGLHDVVLRDGGDVEAIEVGGGASLTAERLVVEHAVYGLDTYPGARADLVDSVFLGEGACAEVDQASVTFRRVSFEGCEEVALGVLGGELTLEDVVFRDGRALPDGSYGQALSLYGLTAPTDVQVRRALFARNREVAIEVYAGASLTLEDAAVIDTTGDEAIASSDGSHGHGIDILEGAATLRRVVFQGNQNVAILSQFPGASLLAEDLLVRDTRSFRGEYGRGLELDQGGVATVHRARFERNRDAAVHVLGDGSRLESEDLQVFDTMPEASSLEFGRALEVAEGGVAQVTRGIFARNQDVTLNAREPRSSLTATDVVVEDTGPRQSDGASGMGVGIYDGGASNLRRFRVEDTPLCGVHVATGELGDGELDLEDGLVVRAAIGACVQVEGYDLDRLQRNVRYIDNGTSLQATMLPVPEAAAPIFGP